MLETFDRIDYGYYDYKTIKLRDRRQSRSPDQGVRMEKPVGWAPELMAIASSGASFLYLKKGVCLQNVDTPPYLLEPNTTLRLLLPLLIHYIALVVV